MLQNTYGLFIIIIIYLSNCIATVNMQYKMTEVLMNKNVILKKIKM